MPKEKSQAITLISPNHGGNYVQSTFNREHLGLALLSAELRQSGFDPQIIDSRAEVQNPDEAAQSILESEPFLVGFSIIAKHACEWVEEVAKRIKEEKPDIHTTVGNYFPTHQPQRVLEIMPNIDSVVIREGDFTLPELALLNHLGQNWTSTDGIAYRTEGKTIVNPHRALITDLDRLPFPEHYAHLLGINEFAIEGSRGCYCRCTFCSTPPFFDAKDRKMKWRPRSPENILDEVQLTLTAHPDIRLFRFTDPDFVGAPKHTDRLLDFAREIRRRKLDFQFIIATRTNDIVGVPENVWRELKKSGLVEVYVGVETASPHIRKAMRKGTTLDQDKKALALMYDLDIRVRYGFMMITPWTQEEDIEHNARILRGLGFPRLDKYFQEMFLVPKTDAIELVKETTKIWWDYDGEGEYYSYELPHPINNLRRIARRMDESSLSFLEQYQRIHDKLRTKVDDQDLQEKLADLALEIFLSVFEKAKQLKEGASEVEVSDCVTDIEQSFQTTLDALELECDQKYDN